MPGLKRPSHREDGKQSLHKKAKSEARPVAASLTTQEIDFPRGGGSTLTPYEHQQVLREVKAEASAAKSARIEKASAFTASDDLFVDGDMKKKVERQRANRDRKNAAKKKTTSTAMVGGSSASRQTKDEEKRPDRIELLNYKRLATGTRMLCSVLAVHPLAVVLSLPNQLLGHVPITNISEVFNARLEGAMDDSDEEEEEEEEENEDNGDESDDGQGSSGKAGKNVPELRDLYQVGQWVVASVVVVHATAPPKVDRGREGGEYEHESRKVELTLEPGSVNEGIVVSDIAPGYLLPMTIKSKEDHGYLMDTGIQGVGGFVSFKDVDNQALHIGQVVNGSVLTVAENGRSISASLKRTKIVSSQLQIGPTISGLMPGNLLKVLVTAISPAGLNVKLFGLFDGTITSFHLSHEQEYQVGQQVKARLLWDIGPVGAELDSRKFALSVAEHVVQLDSSGSTVKNLYPIGTVVQAVVLSTTEDWGLTCAIEGAPLKGFAHISACSDSHVASLPSLTGPFRVKTKHQARVVGHSPTDHVLQLSFQQSVLSRSFMRVSEVSVGEVIKSTIKSITERCIILDINGSVDGVVFPLHFADVLLKKPEKKYRLGQSINARVLKVDPDRNRVSLTLKKTLVQSDLAVVGKLQDAQVGVITHGTVARILEGKTGPIAILVDLFGHLRVYVRIAEAVEKGTTITSETIQSMFFVGKCVKVRLLKVEVDTGKIFGSIRQASESYQKQLSETKAATADKSVKGKKAKGKTAAVVTEENGVSKKKEVEKKNESRIESTTDMEGSKEVAAVDPKEEEEVSEDFLPSDEDASTGESGSSDESEDESDEAGNVGPALELAGGFSWSAGVNDRADEDSQSSSEDESVDGGKREEKKKRKPKGVKKNYQEDLTADLATKTPDSTQDFERLLLGSPNSSYLWIQYMSFQLQLGDIIKGREVARRALQVINFREEQEKFNIWIAMLNLENSFGSDETLEETYKEACAYNDDKKINLRFAEILERSSKLDKADEQWKRTIKKFGFSSKVWVEYHRFLLRAGRSDDARALVPRSMQSLEKRKHVKTIVACALDDFRMGDAERGRTIFEGLVDTYPKRLDIWWQYIDQEARTKNMAQVRDLFDRILSLKQSSKKVKSVLKKWLEYEKKHGNEAGEKAVLERAKRFVEERAQKSQQGDDNDKDDESGEDVE